MPKTAAVLALALALALPFPAGTARAAAMRTLDRALLPTLLDAYGQCRHIAKRAIRQYETRGIDGLVREGAREMALAELPRKTASAVAHEGYAVDAWFLGVLGLVSLRSGPDDGRGRGPEPEAGLRRIVDSAAGFFAMTDEERPELFARTADILATAAARMRESRECRMACKLRYGPGKRSLHLLAAGSGTVTVSVPSADAAILLEACQEGSLCEVRYIGDGDGDFKRVVSARPAHGPD